jgi:MinD superfamily P-loop ATPase
MVCVNKFDINTEKSRLIEEFAGRRAMAFLGRVPFDPAFTRAMVQGRTIFEYDGHSDARAAVVGVWNNLSSRLAKAA